MIHNLLQQKQGNVTTRHNVLRLQSAHLIPPQLLRVFRALRSE